MREEIESIIKEELDEKEVSLSEMYGDLDEELRKLEEAQNKKIREMNDEELKEIIDKKTNPTEEDLAKMQDNAMQESMKYLNRDDN